MARTVTALSLSLFDLKITSPKNILNTDVVPSLRFIVADNPNMYFVTNLKRELEKTSLEI